MSHDTADEAPGDDPHEPGESIDDSEGTSADPFIEGEDFEPLDDTNWEEIPQEEANKILRGLEAIIPDILKRTLVSNIGNLVMNEESIRSIVSDKNLPKEAAGFILGQADATRREILRVVSREIRVFLENMDFGGEIAKILTTLSFEVRTEIRFVPNDEAVRPKVRNRVKIKRQRGKGKEDEEIYDSENPDVSPENPRDAKDTEREKPSGRSGKRSGRRGRWTRSSGRKKPSDS
jgi:hypothetical protein